MAERSAKQLGLSKSDLPNSIIEVIATLTRSGFEAYIVGGGVRDSLLGLNPKDFDAVTDAKPHEVKDLFGKRCRIIGRRFQLAHVYSGRDMIEVATFRAPPKDDTHTTDEGMITRDNVWGDIQQDFARRDFSINALYYQPLQGLVHDFCNAMADIKSKTLRLLGYAPKRIEEDPVRLLRALRFKAKLGFDFDTELSEQFHDGNWTLLEQVSPHRLYDETQKMFTGGYLVPLLPLLYQYGAIKHLIIYPPQHISALVQQVAINTDKRIAAGKSINPAFFYAALLWDNYLYQLNKFKKRDMPFVEAQQQAAIKVIERQRIKTAIPKFAEQFIRDIWILQPKLANPRVKQISQLAEHPRFRAAFDFLLLREQCGDELNPLSESTNGMGEWWQTYQSLSEKQKQQAVERFANGSGVRRGGRQRNRSTQQAEDDNQTSHNHKGSDVSAHSSSVAPKATPKKDNHHTSYAGMSAKHMTSELRQQDVKERAQLQKLSLGETSVSPAQPQPQPLFTISEDKLARQLPSVKSTSSDNTTPKSSKGATSEESTEEQSTKRSTEKKTVASSTTSKNDKTTKASSQSKKTVSEPKKAESLSLPEDLADVVVAKVMEEVPAKRQRRRSAPKSTTKAQSVSGDNGGNTDDNKSFETLQTDHQLPKLAVATNIPATRRRRQPSSSLSVNERLNKS